MRGGYSGNHVATILSGTFTLCYSPVLGDGGSAAATPYFETDPFKISTKTTDAQGRDWDEREILGRLGSIMVRRTGNERPPVGEARLRAFRDVGVAQGGLAYERIGEGEELHDGAESLLLRELETLKRERERVEDRGQMEEGEPSSLLEDLVLTNPSPYEFLESTSLLKNQDYQAFGSFKACVIFPYAFMQLSGLDIKHVMSCGNGTRGGGLLSVEQGGARARAAVLFKGECGL